MEQDRYPFVNTPLPYGYDALEPYIDETTMRLHHNRHLQAYIDNLNTVLEERPRLQSLTLKQLIQAGPHLPAPLRDRVGRNAGGVYNHRFYFESLAPGPTAPEPGRLTRELSRRWGSLDSFQAELRQAALSVFGSGYAWLVVGRRQLRIVTTPNQNCPLAHGLTPILALDVWEHAYYLKHYNDRSAYIADWLSLVNWARAERLLRRAM